MLESSDPGRDIRIVINQAMHQDEAVQTFTRLRQVVQTYLRRDLTLAGTMPRDRAVSDAVRNRKPFALGPDGEVVRAAPEDRLHPRTFRQVDLADAVRIHRGVLLGEERHVHVRPRVELSAGAELEVVGALVQASRAHVAPRVEDLAAALDAPAG